MTIEHSIKSSGSERTLARTLLNAMKAVTDTTLKVDENDVALHAEIQDLAGSGAPVSAQPPRRSFLPKGFANTVQR